MFGKLCQIKRLVAYCTGEPLTRIQAFLLLVLAADTLEEFSLEKNISGMRLKARATGNLSTTNLKLDSQLKQQTEYQKPTTAGGGSDSGDNPDPKPDGGGEAPDPAA